MASRILGAVMIAACLVGGAKGASTTDLKPLDPVALRATVEAMAKELMLPGAMVLLHTPQGDFVFGYGTTELGGTTPPRADTHFRAASNTKTMTAAVIVQLAQEGKLASTIRSRNLLRAFPMAIASPSPNCSKCEAAFITTLRRRNLRKALTVIRPRFGPRRNCSPSRSNVRRYSLRARNTTIATPTMLLLGLVAEKIEGAPLANIFQNRLFGPLGMKNTLLPAGTSNAIPEPYSHGYLYGGSSYALADAPYPADLQAAAKAGTLKPNDDTWQNPSYAFAAGGIISTADDLAIWMRALVGGKIFDADYQRQWLDSLEPEDPSNPGGQKYGYGIAQITFGPNSVYFHGGEMPGYNSFMGHDPVNDVTLIIWTNLTLSLDGQPTANTHAC